MGVNNRSTANDWKTWVASGLLACLACLCLGQVARAHESSQAKPSSDTFQTLTPGLDYRHDVRVNGPLSIHVLRIDRSQQQSQLHTGLGQGTVFGLEPLDKIVGRVGSAMHAKPVAAINGDFFVIKPGPYQGDPTGIQIVNGELVSRPAGTSFWSSPEGELKIGSVTSRLRAIWPDGKAKYPLGLNEARFDDNAVLYTPTLGIRANQSPTQPPGTRTQGGREMVLERIEGQPWLPLAVGTDYAARVREIRETGNTPLSVGRMVLSVGPKLVTRMSHVKPGDIVRLVIETEPDLRNVRTAIGGGRVLVQKGKSPNLGPANQPRHPRSMIGWNSRYLFFIVVDGRQPKLSIGMTYPEMAALVKGYGCTDAIELDGGGSSTVWAMDKILNSPSDGRLRPLANALVVFGSGESGAQR